MEKEKYVECIKTKDANPYFILSTPIHMDNDSMYYKKLKTIYKSIYYDFSKLELKGKSYFLEQLKKTSDDILSVVDNYYKGNLLDALNIMDDLISDLMDSHYAVSTMNESLAFKDFNSLKNKINNTNEINLYRARVESNCTKIRRENMLHLPFEKRTKLSPNRFGIAGLPCLYLGSSSYCCWLEMNMPADNVFNVSCVVVDQTKKILNLVMNSSTMNEIYNRIDNKIEKMQSLKLWLLNTATSFIVEEENRKFKSEYIVSQLLMLSCKKKNLYGVAYYTKKVENDYFAVGYGVNLAVFANYQENSELSPICEDMKVTNSMNYSLFKNLNLGFIDNIGFKMDENNNRKEIGVNIDKISCFKNIGNFDRQNGYCSTDFYKLDKYLFINLYDELKNLEV